MTEARPAKLAFLTQPAPGVFHLNLRIEGGDFYRIEISRGQLANIVVDGAGMALRSTRLGPESILDALESNVSRETIESNEGAA